MIIVQMFMKIPGMNASLSGRRHRSRFLASGGQKNRVLGIEGLPPAPTRRSPEQFAEMQNRIAGNRLRRRLTRLRARARGWLTAGHGRMGTKNLDADDRRTK